MKPRVPVAVAALLSGLAFVALLAFAGCGPSRPSTPEDLFAKLSTMYEAADYGSVWDITTDDRKREFMKAIDDYRDIIRKNPNDKTDAFFKQYHCTRQEMLTLGYVELFRRENLGRERVFVDAKIVDRLPDPRKADEILLRVQLAAGARVYMRAKHEASGWGLVQFQVEPQ
jgi:hypothetical protein